MKITTNIKSFNKKMERKSKAITQGLDKGLRKWALSANKQARHKLSGEGSKYEYVKGKYRRRKSAYAVGVYPVPIVTGDLKDLQGYVGPGQSKRGITAKHGQAWLFNTAIYARAVHDGTGPHKKFGARPFMQDAIDDTHEAGMMAVRGYLRQAINK